MSTQTGSISFESTGNFSQVVKQNYATLSSQIKGQFAVCGTGASTVEKIATTVPTNADWTLYAGATVTVKFTSANTASVPTLNVNGTGPKQIRDYNANELLKAAREWPAGAAIAFTYDGTYWRIQDSNLMERVHSAETRVDQTATSITSLASMEDNYTRPDGTTATNNLKSYVDQTAEGITTTIENITETVQHSGNLLPHTSVTIADREWLSTNIRSAWTDIPIVSAGGYDAYKYDSSWAPAAYWSGYWYKLRANTYYTYSVDVYYTKTVSFNMQSLGHFQVWNANSDKNDKSHEDVAEERIFSPSTIPANTWTRASVTFLTNSLDDSSFAVYPRFNIAADDGTLYFKNAQLEYGKIATGWNPSSFDLSTVTNTVNSVKQTADANTLSISGLTTTTQSLRDDLDNLEIGGRNLFKDSETISMSSWTYENASNSNGIAEVLTTGSGNHRIYQMPANGYWSWESDTEYVVSIEAKCSDDNGKLQMNPVGAAVTWKEFPLTTEWKRYAYTFTSGNNVTTGSMSFYNTGASDTTVYLRKPKLEKGNKATDWSPAPEDVQGSITTLESRSSKIEQTLDGFSSTVGAIVDETVTGTNILTGNALNPYNWTVSAPASASYTKTAYGTAGVKVQFSTISGYERLYSPAITVVSGKKYTLSVEYTVGKDYVITSGRGGFGLSVYKAAPTDTFDSSNINFVARAQFLETATRVAMKATITFTAPFNTIYLGLNGAQINDGQSGLSFTLDKLTLVENISSRMSSAETTISQTANNVLIKATESDTTAAQGGQHLIESLINVAPSGVTISADKVNIEGAAIFTGSGRLSSTSLNNAYDSKGSAAAVQMNLNNLEIGGRNLVLSSGSLSRWAKCGRTYGTITIDGPMATITASGNTANRYLGLRWWVNTPISELGEVVVSFDVMSPNWSAVAEPSTYTGLAAFGIQFNSTDNDIGSDAAGLTSKAYVLWRLDNTTRWKSVPTATNGKWLHFESKPFTFNSSVLTTDSSKGIGVNIAVYPMLRCNGTVSIRNFKLEKGNKATDWSTAPEDADVRYDGVNLAKNSADIPRYVQSNVTSIVGGKADPDGGTGAYLVTPSASSWWLSVRADDCLLTDLEPVYTASVWLRADNATTCRLCVRYMDNALYSSTATRVTFDVSTTWKRYSVSGALLQAQTSDCFWIGQLTTEPIYVYHPKIEKGDKPTDWTPSPDDFASASDSVEYIVGTQTAATNLWTGVTKDTTLATGKTIAYYLPYAGNSSAATLNLTLSGGGTSGAKGIKFNSNNSAGNSITTHYGAGSVINMTYDGTYWRVAASYYDTSGISNARYRTQWANAIKAVTAITAGYIICGTSSGYKHLASGVTFDLSYPLLYAGSAIVADATGTGNYLTFNGVNASTSGSITAGGANKTLYLIGTVSGNTFTVASSGYLTCTLPTAVSDPVQFYIPIGIMYNATSIYFNSSKDLYAFVDGSFRQVNPTDVVATQKIYYRSKFSGTVPVPTSWITLTTDKYNDTISVGNNGWSTKITPIANGTGASVTKYLYLYTCEQRKRLDGTVKCLPEQNALLDDSVTIIDGGNIITGSIAANTIKADSGTFNTANIPNLSAAKITSGDITTDRIKANAVNAINATVNKIDAKNINVSEINIGDLAGSIGGKNLALDSDQPYNWQKYTPTTYEIAQVKMTEDFIPGETYTVTIWGGPITRSDKSSCWYALYWGGGNFSLANTTLVETGVYRATFTISTTNTAQHTAVGNNILDIYNTPAVGASGTTYSAPITKIQIEKGNVGTEWEPAQEELPRPNLYKTTTSMAYIVGSGSSASGTITAHDDSYHGRTLTVTTAGGTLRISNIIPKTNIPYTVSFILTASVATTIGVDIMDNTVKTITVPKGTSKVIFTSTPTRAVDSTYHFIDMVFNTAGTYKMENIKVEMGTVATTWIEAEQISNYIHADSTGINIYDNRLSNANKYYLRQTAGGTYIYRNTYLKAKYEDTITLYGGSSTSGANPKVELSSSAFNMYDDAGKKRVTIDTSGLTIYDASATPVDIANFGTTVGTTGTTAFARIGKSGSSRFEISPTTLSAYTGNTKYFEVSANGLIWGNNITAASQSYVTSQGYQTSSDVQTAITNADTNKRDWYATCPTAAATAAKVATIDPVTTKFSLVAGQTVKVLFSNTNSAAVADLTLNVNSKGAKNIKYIYNGGYSDIPAANYLKANQIYTFTYDGTYWIITLGYNTNSNTYDRTLHNNYIKATAAITSGKIICGTSSGYKNLAASTAFDISYPLLYSGEAVAANGQTAKAYERIPGVNIATTLAVANIPGIAANKVVFIKGTISGTTFTTASANFLTCTPPSSAVANEYYIPIGILANDYSSSATNKLFFETSKELWSYNDGAFGPTSIRNASAAAKTATNYMVFTDNALKIASASPGTQKQRIELTSSSLTMFSSDDKQRFSVNSTNGVIVGRTDQGHVAITDTGMTIYGSSGNDLGSFAATTANNETTYVRIGPTSTTSTSSRVLIKSTGMEIFKGATSVALFGDTATIGINDNQHSHITLDYHSLQLIDKEGNTYFHVSDLRDNQGQATIKDVFYGDGTTKAFNLSLTATNNTYTVTVSNSSGGTVTKTTSKVTFASAPTSGATITITYSCTDSRIKAFTFGTRKTNSSIGVYSFSEGYNSSAQGHYSHAEGFNTIAGNIYTHAEGYCTQANGWCSHAEGCNTIANSYYSHAEGFNTRAYQQSSHAEGNSTIADGQYSHAEGVFTTANGGFSHAEGQNSIANSPCSHAEGHGTLANKDHSHAEGYNTIANGLSGHAEGYNTIAGSDYSHAQGRNTIANGQCSHAEGYNTKTNNSYSHAEGHSTIANNYSHAEGYGTKADGLYSHAEGYNTLANGIYSHASGYYTIAEGYQFVCGKYNSNQSNSLFEVGNGTGANTRKNALTLDTDGNLTISGTITANGVAVSLSRTSLYENTSGKFSGAIPLSETAANFTFIEIYCKDNDGRYCYTKVWSPNGKTVNVTQTLSYGGNFYVKSKAYTISGTGMDTANTSGTYHTGEVNAAGNNSGSTVDNLGVVKVIGYK